MANEYVNKVVMGDETLIDISSDTATPDKVAKGVTFHDKTGAPQTGTSTYDADTSDADASAAEILKGKSGYVNGVKVVGTMPNNAGNNVEISDTNPVAIPQGFYDGSGKAKLSDTELAKLVPGNIKEGVTLLGVTGEYGADDISSQSKEVTASFADQNVQPDEGYSFLSSVVVKAMPVTRTDNTAGGVTVKIGA